MEPEDPVIKMVAGTDRACNYRIAEWKERVNSFPRAQILNQVKQETGKCTGDKEQGIREKVVPFKSRRNQKNNPYKCSKSQKAGQGMSYPLIRRIKSWIAKILVNPA